MMRLRVPGFLGVASPDAATERARDLADAFARQPTSESSPIAREALESIADLSARAYQTTAERDAAMQAINWTALAALALMV